MRLFSYNRLNKLTKSTTVTNEHFFVNDSPENTGLDAAMAAVTQLRQDSAQLHDFPPADDLQRQLEIPVDDPTKEVDPAAEKKSCGLCMDEFEGAETIAAQFPYQCNGCSQKPFCLKCIKDWFLDACRNESKMPPKCCVAIPLAAIAEHLSAVEVPFLSIWLYLMLTHDLQIELYKVKYEEWNTSDRIYCPIPSCSTFIPPRLYIQPPVTSAPLLPNNNKTAILLNEESANENTPSGTTMRPSVGCPICHTLVCTACHTSSHIGACPLSDLEPGMEQILSKFKIKRCPKCRAGIRKMFGCSHVNCLCGAHFCWGCLDPIDICGGSCGQDDEDEDGEEGEVEEDDLDAGAFDGNGRNFGLEPVASSVDQWGCVHQWTTAPERPDVTVPGVYQHEECRSCFRSLNFSGIDNGMTEMGWECRRCGNQICGACRSASDARHS